jgi:aryl-alcohol dehydrogenase-like predicted oxidoreductase
MQQRRFGRLRWTVSELGYGTWGMGGWTESSDAESLLALQCAADRGVTFFDTALAYGDGHSERLLQQLLKANPEKRLYVATKIPPKGGLHPVKRGDALSDTFPPDHIVASVERSAANLGVDSIDVVQFHNWHDDWAADRRWQQAVEHLKREKLIRGIGISINRWECSNSIRALETGLIDSVQVIYNVFDQAAADELFPKCAALDVAVIARVPFAEGSLTGTLTAASAWPAGDWRNSYFNETNLTETVQRVGRLAAQLGPDELLPDVALRFVLANPTVSVVIPGMRKPSHVLANLAAVDRGSLPPELLAELGKHRWNRESHAGEWQ